MAFAYRFGRVEVRPAERLVRIDGEPAAVVGRAYDLLLALIDRRDRVVAKSELMDQVWPGVAVDEHNLHTQVSILRRIVGRDAIATVAGRGYRLVAPVDAVASQAGSAIPSSTGLDTGAAFSDGPSVAVLPLVNLSGDPDQVYFSDGISEDIITDLSRVPGVLVVARSSSFSFRQRGCEVRTIGRELGVQAVLEGSVRRVGSRVRISAQLIDVGTGAHLWADRYDRQVDDIDAIQNDVTDRIVAAIRAALTPLAPTRSASPRTRNALAHDQFLLGRELLRGSDLTREVFDRMVAAFGQAISIDPGFAAPYACLAIAHCLDFQNGLTGNPDAIEVASRLASVAVRCGPDEPEAHYAMANVAIWKADLSLALTHADLALALNPNYALAHGMRGCIEVYLGAPASGIGHLHRAMRLDPYFTHQNLHFLGTAHLVAGAYDAAAAAFRERIRLSPRTDLSRSFLASSLGHLGQVGPARIVWRELKAINPAYSFDAHLQRLPFQCAGARDRIRDGLTQAGLPD